MTITTDRQPESHFCRHNTMDYAVITDGHLPRLELFTPGAVVILMDRPGAVLTLGIEARKAGWEVRDTISVHTVSGMHIALLLRAPFTGTLTANIAAHGTGALNIDACRIGGDGDDPGRWPADVIFVHSPDCHRLGQGTVTTNRHHPARRGPGRATCSGHTGQDELAERRGRETVTVYDCAPGCPVAELDRQSGILTSGANPARRRTDSYSVSMSGPQRATSRLRVARGQDSGGASRLYPVFESVAELMLWFDTLLRPAR